MICSGKKLRGTKCAVNVRALATRRRKPPRVRSINCLRKAHADPARKLRRVRARGSIHQLRGFRCGTMKFLEQRRGRRDRGPARTSGSWCARDGGHHLLAPVKCHAVKRGGIRTAWLLVRAQHFVTMRGCWCRVRHVVFGNEVRTHWLELWGIDFAIPRCRHPVQQC